MPAVSRLPALVTGAVGGLFAGLTGVGGGAIMIPLLTGLLGLSQRLAHGTSLAVVLFVGIAGFFAYALIEDVAWQFVPLLSASSIVSAALGARYLQRAPELLLRRVFAAFLLAVSVRMIIG